MEVVFCEGLLPSRLSFVEVVRQDCLPMKSSSVVAIIIMTLHMTRLLLRSSSMPILGHNSLLPGYSSIVWIFTVCMSTNYISSDVFYAKIQLKMTKPF